MSIIKSFLKKIVNKHTSIFRKIDNLEKFVHYNAPSSMFLSEYNFTSYPPLFDSSNIQYVKSNIGQDAFVAGFFNRKKNGIFLELGGFDGITSSNTYFLEYALQWNGILIEANPNHLNNLKKNRPNQIIIPCAVSDVEGELPFGLHENNGTGCLIEETTSSGKPVQADYQIENKDFVFVKTRRLEDILEEQKVTHIDFFSLDIEGLEPAVIRGINFDKVNIILMEIECNTLDRFEEIYLMMEERGYVMVTKGVISLEHGGRDVFYAQKKYVESHNLQSFKIDQPGIMKPPVKLWDFP